MRVGDTVRVDVQLGTADPRRPGAPIGTHGIVSHEREVLPGSTEMVVRFEHYRAGIYLPQDLRVMYGFSVSLTKCLRPKEGEMVELTVEIAMGHYPAFFRIPAGTVGIVEESFETNGDVNFADYWAGSIPVAWSKTRDYYDRAFAGLVTKKVVRCPLRTCDAENDLDVAVKTCWRCGTKLP